MARLWVTPMILLLSGVARAEDATTRGLHNEADLLLATELRLNGNFQEAADLYRRLADRLPELDPGAEKARFLQAECLRLQERLPEAAKTYAQALNDYPCGNWRGKAMQQLFDIANYWLDDTREEMRQAREQNAGKRLIVWPAAFHWDATKPLLAEFEALRYLKLVQYSDPSSALAVKALFLVGHVHFFREEYDLADPLFSTIVNDHPESELAPHALKMAALAKWSWYGISPDPHAKLNEMFVMVTKGLEAYPQLRERDRKFLWSMLDNASNAPDRRAPGSKETRRDEKEPSWHSILIRVTPTVAVPDWLEPLANELIYTTGTIIEVLGQLQFRELDEVGYPIWMKPVFERILKIACDPSQALER